LRRIIKWMESPRIASTVIVLLVFTVVVTAKRWGWLQFLEFRAYDQFIQWQPRAADSEPLALVQLTEQDIQNPRLDYPLWDNKMAELLTAIESHQPAVIGLDIWRDVPVPKSGEFLPLFNEVLRTNDNLIAIYTLGGIMPPPALWETTERLGFNDNFPVDYDVDLVNKKVRRTILTVEAESGPPLRSLAFCMADRYLSRQGIHPVFDQADGNMLRWGNAALRPLGPTDGAYVGADTRGWQMLLDFKCPEDFARYSVTEVLEGRIPPGALRDKIVLIGINADSVFDDMATPIHFKHRGMEVQAGAIQQLLRLVQDGAPSLRFWPDGIEDFWVLLWCVIGGAIGYRVRSPWRFALVALAAVGVVAGGAWGAFMAGWWIPLFAPLAGCLPSAALVTSYVSHLDRKERGQLMQLFSKEVSPDIAQALWDHRDELLAGRKPQSKKLVATVLFTDLVGFSTTSEGLDPAHLMDWLNEYMDGMARAVMDNHGVVEKYIGDSVMAVFGIPIPRTTAEEQAQDARNAVRCALAMERELVKLNEQWKARGLPIVGMRVGIHTGELVAGSLGSTERSEYTVIGDSVNTASRLESFDKENKHVQTDGRCCRVLVSGRTHELLGNLYITRPVGAMNLKGKAESVTIFHVVEEQSPQNGGGHGV
jgi:adenylate cyclase